LVDAYVVGKLLYPDRFAHVDLALKADEIFSFFVGTPVYQDMVKDFGTPGAEVGF
ncbi:iron complex transport system substrate-binding protein, partial [Desulfacinum hydrothermale DSM 13146]